MQDDRTAGRSLAWRARADLARRLGVPESQVEVLEVHPVEWPDASLGCPEPGKVYAAVITPGFRILLQVAGRRYEYRSDRQRVRLCSGGQHD
ncbi:MAG: hypothetical protein HPY83_04680 [Anaerolineae bacterium]|nr:hypothetical protein [Anaerolineae bacterium]